MSDTEFIKHQQFLDALREKGLHMGSGNQFGPETLGIVGQVIRNILGPAPTALTLQVDNGYMVLFSPSQEAASSSLAVGAAVRHRGAPYPTGGFPSGEDEQQRMKEELVRRRQIAMVGLRKKVRIRVYPSLSQAMDEIKKFYEAGGIVSGIDFEKLADETMNDIGDPEAFGV